MKVRRAVLALLAGFLFAGAMLASAATLGGLTSSSLGADESVVASCNTDGVTVDWDITYSASEAGYVVTDVVVSDIDVACDGLDLSVTVADDTNAELSSGVLTVSGTSAQVTLDDEVLASAVEFVAVAIVG